MYYAPQHFKAHEIFPRILYEGHLLNRDKGTVSNNIWRLMDRRVLWTLDQMREIHGITIVNDYYWGGNNQYRGYRPQLELLDIEDLIKRLAAYQPGDKINFQSTFSSFTSQHCLGQAIDCKFKNKSAEEVRQHIRANPHLPAYKYITAVEEGVSWLHFDVRNWDATRYGILYFKS